MADYLLLYSGGGMPETEEEQAQVMKAWDDWFTQLGGALKDGGNPFSSAAKTVKPDGSVSNGAGADASGYSVIQADSIDDAAALAKGCPVLMGGASISVYETFEVM
ncbi:MAG: YciI family protein [Actinomycetota bacterium]